jgi:hypothetical protein
MQHVAEQKQVDSYRKFRLVRIDHPRLVAWPALEHRIAEESNWLALFAIQPSVIALELIEENADSVCSC